MRNLTWIWQSGQAKCLADKPRTQIWSTLDLFDVALEPHVSTHFSILWQFKKVKFTINYSGEVDIGLLLYIIVLLFVQLHQCEFFLGGLVGYILQLTLA